MAVAFTQAADVAGVASVSNVLTYTDKSIGVPVVTIDYGAGEVEMTVGRGAAFAPAFCDIFFAAAPFGATATFKVTLHDGHECESLG